MLSKKSFVSLLASTLAVLFILSAVLVATLSFSVPRIAERYLQKYHIDLTIEETRIHLLKGEMEISGLTLADQNSDQAISLERLRVALSLPSLLKRHILIDELNLEKLHVPVRETDNGILLAGIDQDRFTSDSAPTDTADTVEATGEAFSFGWGNITASDLTITYAAQSNTESTKAELVTLFIDKLNTGPLSSTNTSQATPIDIALFLDEIALTATGAVAPLNSQREGKLDINIANFSLGAAKAIIKNLNLEAPAFLNPLKGDFDYQGQLAWQLADTGGQVDLKQNALSAKELYIPLGEASADSPDSIAGDVRLLIDVLTLDLDNKAVAIKAIHSEKSRLVYINEQHQPKTSLTLSNLALSIDQVDTADKNLASKIDFQASINEFGKLKIHGRSKLMSFTQSTEIAADAEQIALTDFSGFSIDTLNRSIEKGALDFTFNGKVENDLIDSNTQLQIHQLGFSAAPDIDKKDNETGSCFESELGIPLNTALNLLRDKDDSIRIAIPVTGPVDDPEINLTHIINTAIFKTIKTAVLTQLGPMMAITAIDKIRSLNDAMKLHPVFFEPGKTTLDTEAQANLKTLADFLKKKEKLSVNVCSVALHHELFSQDTVVSEEKDSAKEAGDNERLLSLANQRSAAVKQYLIDNAIDGKRLILCQSSIAAETSLDDPELRPKVEFSL